MPQKYTVCRTCGVDSSEFPDGRINHLRTEHGFTEKSYKGIIKQHYRMKKENGYT